MPASINDQQLVRIGVDEEHRQPQEGARARSHEYAECKALLTGHWFNAWLIG
jgi:hypothetical protein